MARLIYASGPGDVFAAIGVDGDYELPPAATYTVWTAGVGGSQHTDLLTVAGAPITVVTPESGTGRARFQGLDGYEGEYWLDIGGGVRYRVHPDGMAERIKALEDASAGVGVTDGDKGDITVSSSGTVWNIDASAVGTTEIADSAVTLAKMADASVGTTEIADNAVTNAKLADSAVSTAELATNAVTNVKIADNAVNTAEIVDGAVTSAKLAAGAVATMPAFVPFFVVKAAGVWGARPDNDPARLTLFVGPDPAPAIITSGTAGMYAGDIHIVAP